MALSKSQHASTNPIYFSCFLAYTLEVLLQAASVKRGDIRKDSGKGIAFLPLLPVFLKMALHLSLLKVNLYLGD